MINPKRFVFNQLRKAGFLRSELGAFEATEIFYLRDFTVVSGENVSETIASYGVYEPSLTEAFLHLVKNGDIVVDIGMHLGYYTTLFASLVGSQGEVHAFEPTPSTRELASRNTRRFSQIHVHPYAVWSSEESLAFRDYGIKWMAFNSFSEARTDEGMPEPKMFDVQTTTMDVFRSKLGKKISLLKIDAESAELEILNGARETLKSDSPIVSLEVGDSDGKATSRGLIDHMRSLGYEPWEFRGDQFVKHQVREVYDYDNLMFAPASRPLNIGS